MLLGIVVTRVASIDATWTTVHLARAALARGHGVRFIEPWDLEVDERGHLLARCFAFDPPAPSPDAMVSALATRRAPRRQLRLDSLDALLLRAAPLDNAVLAFAARARDLGVPVINDPAGILRVTNKAWLASLPDVPTPTGIVTRSRGAAHAFSARHKAALVVKPASGSGGRGVSLVPARDDEALDRAFDLALGRTGMGERHVVVQVYLEEAEAGEKRLMWMDGEVLGGYLRRRADGEFRHNLKQGGLAEPTAVSSSELAAIAPLTPHLLRAGIRLAGIDLIGHHVIEVNALNPGGAFHTDRLHGSDVGGAIVERLAGRPLTTTGGSPWERLAP